MDTEIVNTRDGLAGGNNQSVLLDTIKHHCFSQTSNTMTLETRDQLQEAVQNYLEYTLKGSVKNILFGGIVTCPWYAIARNGQYKTRQNSIMVVYSSSNKDILSSIDTLPREEQVDVGDQNWFHCVEVFHFVRCLLKGKARYVEAVYLPEESFFIIDDKWFSFLKLKSQNMLTNMERFLGRCRAQAICSVAKKVSGKALDTSRMVLKDNATMYEFCDSLRLLLHISNALKSKCLLMGDQERNMFPADQSSVDEALGIMISLNCEDSHWDETKHKLFDIILRWTNDIDIKLAKHNNFTPPAKIESHLKCWLLQVRIGDEHVDSMDISTDAKSKVAPILKHLGEGLASIMPENIVLIARAGSILYGLDIPDSDIDYVVVYAERLEVLLTTLERPTECYVSRGPDKLMEYGAYEARLLCQMLWKGSVDIVELIFSDSVDYASQHWEVLQSNRSLFVTRTTVQKYFELIEKKLKRVESGKYKSREDKLLYHVFHKLYCVEEMINGLVPCIKVGGAKKDFIMKIREGPLTGDFNVERLCHTARERLIKAKDNITLNRANLPDNVSYDFLTEWLIAIRCL